MSYQPLVSQYLETISGTALEKHQKIVREYVKRRNGIYALYKRDHLYYVGLATNLRNRLNNHLKDKHKGKWDRFSVYLTVGDTHLKELESLVLRIVHPSGNSQSGKFRKAQDLKKQLTRDLLAASRRELDTLLNRKRKLKADMTQTPSTARVLARISERRIKLKGWYKDNQFNARLLLNGEISFAGKRYETPSEAAKAALKRRANGWWFWQYERAPGDWVRLRELKRH